MRASERLPLPDVTAKSAHLLFSENYFVTQVVFSKMSVGAVIT